jgi:hypothetical protein
MDALVGGEHATKRCAPRRAYDLAYAKLYGALPDCRGCDCV